MRVASQVVTGGGLIDNRAGSGGSTDSPPTRTSDGVLSLYGTPYQVSFLAASVFDAVRGPVRVSSTAMMKVDRG